MRLAGRTAIVTGVDNVVSRGVAMRFSTEGAQVVVVDGGGGAAVRLSQEIRTAGGKSVAVSADLVSEAGWATTLATCQSTYGAVDLLFNGMHAFRAASIQCLDVEEFCQLFDRVAISAWLGQKYAIGVMRNHGCRGSVINLVSALARVGAADCSGQCSAARGVLISTKSAALECAREGDGIVVNALVVGRIDHAPDHFPGARALPEVDAVSPARVAAAAVFLAAEGARFMTGAELTVDAGLLGVR